MATIDYFGDQSGGHPTRRSVNGMYVRKVSVDFARALELKGSALAASDVITVSEIPAGTLTLGGGLNVTTAPANVTTLTLDLGPSSGAGDTWVDGHDATSTGWGAAGSNGSITLGNQTRETAAATVDLTVASLTGTLADGVVDVYMIMADLT